MGVPLVSTDFGTYEFFQGAIWISRQNSTVEFQGTNISIMDQATGELKVIAFVIRKGDRWTYGGKRDFTLEEIVDDILVSFGWKKEVRDKLLAIC